MTLKRPLLQTSPNGTRLFPGSGTFAEARRITEILRKETVGGALLVIAATIALILSNSPLAEWYFELRDLEFGVEAWRLRLSLGTWASDGLLAMFFFLVGLELKREFVAGDLRRISTAIVPIASAVGGVLVPAIIYTTFVWQQPELRQGWAIPTATDIAFAVAVLAIIGSRLPSPLRIFLLTLAVVDDLIAIGIIALCYTDRIEVIPLAIALAVIVVYGFIAHRYREMFGLRPFAAWVILLPLGVIAWAFMHASGIHATIAGVLLGFTVPVLQRRSADRSTNALPGLAEEFEHRFRPLSAGIAVPVFAFFAAGVAVGGWEGVQHAAAHPITLAVMLALVLGKPIGIVATSWLTITLTRTRLDPQLRWIDMIGVGMLAGIGFTVSLLVAELSFAEGSVEHDYAKVAVLSASVISALAASLLLGIRNRQYGRMRLREEAAAADSAKESVIEIRRHGIQGVPLVRQFWEALFDHHVSIGAAGLATIEREKSWPLRRAHYERLFDRAADPSLWVASIDGDALGYAVAYADMIEGERVMVLETLSVLASARGHGLGSQLMEAVDHAAAYAGIELAAVDVMGGNPRARELYLRAGYEPHSESWMRSAPPALADAAAVRREHSDDLGVVAARLGLDLSMSPGPDDTWQSSDDIIELSGAAGLSGFAEQGDFAELRMLFGRLADAGLWTIRFELPASPALSALRTFLIGEGFRLSTERLIRRPARRSS